MKDAHELLAKLRAAGVEPMPENYLRTISEDFNSGKMNHLEWYVRLFADLLEARAKLAKLAEVREWAEAHASEPAESEGQAVGRLCGKEVLGILDREPGS